MDDWTRQGGVNSAGAGRGGLRASQAEREQTVEVLKAAFAAGRLAKDEFEARVDQALTSKTRGELTAVTDDLPAGPAVIQPTARTRPPANTTARTGLRVITAATAVTAASWAGAGSGPAAVMLAWTFTITWLGILILTVAVMLESRRQQRSAGKLPPHGTAGRTSLGY
jgi:Domain of unknown function (DUF1707)